MAQGGDVRNRKVNAKKRSKLHKEKPITTATLEAPAEKNSTSSTERPHAFKDETLWETFMSHPLGAYGPYLLAPVVLYFALNYVVLKNPEIVSALTLGVFSLRPAVRREDTRQVLILGSIGSGTIPLAKAVRDVLHLEIGHETAEATKYFTRDGTISSVLGVRYVPSDLPPIRLSQLLDDWCLKRHKDANVFKPSMFYPSSCYSFLGSWTECDTKECLFLVSREHGCALRRYGTCQPSFGRVLHQVRHPLSVIGELMSRVCPTHAKKPDTPMHPAFRQLATAYLNPDFEFGSCLESVAWYVIDFNRAILAARGKGLIHAMYRYEESSLCDIAKLAGFLDPEQVVYAPNQAKVLAKCGPLSTIGDASKKLPLLAKETDQTRKVPEFGWDDFRTAGGAALVTALKNLCKELGYNPDQLPDSPAESTEEFQSNPSTGQGKVK